MKSLLKLIGWLIGIVVILVLAAGVALTTLDPNDYKDWIAGKVKEETGRDVTLAGNIGLTLYPWLGLELNDVTVANAPGFGSEPFLKVEHLNARIKTMPLLRDQYEVDTVVLHGAALNLERNKEGKTNWDDLASGEGGESEPLPLTAVVLGGVDIKRTSLVWTDQTTGTQYRVEDLTAATGPLTYGAPINLSLAFKGAANQPELTGDLKLDGVISYDLDKELYGIKPLTASGNLRGKNVPGGQTDYAMSTAVAIDLEQETATISDLQVKALDGEVKGQIAASNIEDPKPSVKADVTAQGKDLALFLKVLEIEPLASQVAQLSDRGFNVATTVDADMERGDVNVPKLSANMLGATLNGQVKATNINSDTPAYQGALKGSGPDLPLLMRVLGQFQGKNSPLSRAGTELAGYPERAFSVDLEFDADMKDGRVNLPRLDAKGIGATVAGKVQGAAVNTSTPSLKGTINASGPDLPILLVAAGQFQPQPEAPGGLADIGRKLATHSSRAFDVKSDFDVDLKSGKVSLPSLAINTLGLEVNGNINAANMESSSGTVQGKLAASGTKMKELLRGIDQEALGEVLRSVNFEANIGGTRGDLKLAPMSLSAVVAGEQVGKTPVEVKFNADTRINLDAESLELTGLSLNGLGLDAKGNVIASKILSTPEVKGDINVAPFNLRQLLAKLNQPAPVTADKQVLQKVAVQAVFAGSGTTLNLDNLHFVMDETNLKGDVAIDVTEKKKKLARFDLDIDQLNADRYLAPEEKGLEQTEAGGGSVPRADAAEGPPARLPVKMLRQIDVQGELRIGKLIFSKAELNNVKLNMLGRDGKLTMDPVTAELYKGGFDGDINLDVTGKLPKMVMNAKLDKVAIAPMLNDVSGDSKIRGQLNGSAALTAVGRNADALKQTINGQMSFSVANGAIKGFNLGKIMRQGKSLSSDFTLAVSDKEETDFTEITGNPVAKNGVVTLDDLSGKSPALRLGGNGVLADLPRNQMDYTVTATMVATSKGQGGKELEELQGVPLECTLRGPLDAPVRECDASKLLAALGVQLLQGVVSGEGLKNPLNAIAPGLALPGAAAGTAAGVAGAAAGALLGGGSDSDSKSAGATPLKAQPAEAKPQATQQTTQQSKPQAVETKPAVAETKLEPAKTTQPAKDKPATTETQPKPVRDKPATRTQQAETQQTQTNTVKQQPAAEVQNQPAAAEAQPAEATDQPAGEKKKKKKKKRNAAKTDAGEAAMETEEAAESAETAETPE